MKVSAVLITREKEYPKEIQLDGFDEVIVRTDSPHVYQRYIEASNAKNDIIYVQDDDCIVDYKELFDHYDGRITNTITQHHKDFYNGTGITLVGWGCFFPKSMLSVFDMYIDRYGEDKHLFREADRIFTYLNQPHNTLVREHRDLRQTDRMYHDPSHFPSMMEALTKLRNL